MNSKSILLSELITAGAQRTPNKIAFKSVSDQFTYSELDQKSNRLAHWLVAQGVKKGDRVGILIEKDIYAAYAVYGVLKAGGVLVALDPNQPGEKLDDIITDCGIEILLSVPSLQRKIDQIDTGQLLVLGSVQDQSWDEVFSGSSDARLSLDIQPTDLAYILYTSGSTGEPKGIVHTHASGMAYARQSALLYQVTERDVIGNVAALHFDQSTFGYFSAIYAGCTTYVFGNSELVMLASFCEAVRRHDISILYTVPSLFISLLRGDFDIDFPSVRWIKYGGESFPPSKVNELMQRAPRAQISNVYGPAEVNQCTYYTIDKPVNPDLEVPIGKVWDHTDYLIVNEKDQPVAQGEQGEFLVHSNTMMNGYWHNDELNERSFYKTTRDGKDIRYYRTGDFVYQNAVNELVFVGRMDRQVKISGYRIELEVVEQVLIRCEEVKDAAVFTIKSNGMRELCAAIVPQTEVLNSGELRKKLLKLLPKQSVPKHLFQVPSMPHSDNGKVHYRKLEKQFSN